MDIDLRFYLTKIFSLKKNLFFFLIFLNEFKKKIIDSSDTCITTSTRKESGERSRGAGHSKGDRGMGGVGGSGGVSGGGGGGSDGKPTRVRTVLNEKQLHTLRTCYAANPRPDALMKEQLVEMTGLSPRVIRVWFQNKRCKDKKKAILMKQIQQQEKVGHHPHLHDYHSSTTTSSGSTSYCNTYYHIRTMMEEQQPHHPHAIGHLESDPIQVRKNPVLVDFSPDPFPYR